MFDQAAAAEIPAAVQLRARELAMQMLRNFGDHLAANWRGDEDWAREAIQGIREANGEHMWPLIVDELIFLDAEMQAQEFNDRLLEEIQAFVATHRAETEDTQQQAQAGAENHAGAGPGPQPAARVDLLQIEGIPDLIDAQIDAMIEGNMQFDAAFAPLNGPARNWVERHVRIRMVIEAVGVHDLHQRLPHLERSWQAYLAHIPPQLVQAMIRDGMIP